MVTNLIAYVDVIVTLHRTWPNEINIWIVLCVIIYFICVWF